MYKYILKRLFLFVITIVIIVIVTFFLMRAVGKTPTAIDDLINKRIAAAPHTDPSLIRQSVFTEMNYHPDWNAFRAFGSYIKGVFHGDFGTYFDQPDDTITHQFSAPLKWTFMISGLGFIFGTIIGMAFGIFAGYKRGKMPDILLNIISIVFVAVPSFVLASFVVLWVSNSDWPLQFLSVDLSGSFGATFKTLILPIFIITVTSFATITYYIRNEVVEVLKSDYVTTARSKGLSETKIFFKHVLRNISIPAVTIIIPRFIFIIMGSFVVEMFFGVPGAASMISTAATTFEYNVIMFSVIFFTSLSLLVNILLDVIYALLDPRIKLAEKSRKSFIRNWRAKRQRNIELAELGEVSNE